MWISQAGGAVVSSLNNKLAEVVGDMMSKSDGVIVSNVGGWHSPMVVGEGAVSFLADGAHLPGLHGSAVRALRLHILQQVSSFLEALAPPGKNATSHIDRVFVTTRESWANVNWKGNWNSEHSHSKVTISGVYYVQSGFPKRIQKPISREQRDSLRVRSSGLEYSPQTGLQFINPREAPTSTTPTLVASTAQPPGSDGEPEIFHYRDVWTSEAFGRAGTLAIWPGGLSHWVPPHTGELARISIAFNVELTQS